MKKRKLTWGPNDFYRRLSPVPRPIKCFREPMPVARGVSAFVRPLWVRGLEASYTNKTYHLFSEIQKWSECKEMHVGAQ